MKQKQIKKREKKRRNRKVETFSYKTKNKINDFANRYITEKPQSSFLNELHKRVTGEEKASGQPKKKKKVAGLTDEETNDNQNDNKNDKTVQQQRKEEEEGERRPQKAGLVEGKK